MLFLKIVKIVRYVYVYIVTYIRVIYVSLIKIY